MFTFVRTGHLQHTSNPLLYKKYCTGMYSIINIYTIYNNNYVLINIEDQTNQFVKLD
jgi:hypothetical protein